MMPIRQDFNRIMIKNIISSLLIMFSATLFADVFCWKVSDGDTIWVADESGKRTKIRMNKIDAPELNQPFGKESADRLAALVLGKYITLESSGKDQYGRSLDVVFIETNTTTHAKMDVNLQLVKEGLAWHYYTDHTPAYTNAENEAKAKKIGLWGGSNPINPYQWRKMRIPAAPDKEYNSRKVAIPKTIKGGK